MFLRQSLLPLSRHGAVLGVFLAGYFYEAWHVASQIGPFRGDPDYSYLFGGLSILNLQTPAFVDHPGTPVQLAIAAISLLLWLARLPFGGLASLSDDIITHAELYLGVVCGVFALLTAAAMIFFVRSLRTAAGSIAPGVIALLLIFTSDVVFFTFTASMPSRCCSPSVLCWRDSSPAAPCAKKALAMIRAWPPPSGYASV